MAPGSRRGSTRGAATAVALMAVAAAGGCGEREAPRGAIAAVVSAGALTDACAGDSLRPATAAPAPGLWLYEQSSGERVAAMIGPPQPDDRALVVTHPVESVEVTAAGDTIRHRVAAAAVSLELLPPLGPLMLGDSAGSLAPGAQPAATYAPSPRVRLAAYEPCATSIRDPRVRYLRRDAAGRTVTDVLLQRASER